MAKKHVVIAAVAGGVALTIAGGVAVAMALHKNDVVLSVDGETHNVSVREDTVKQVLEKDGITVGEHDVVAPSLDTKITNGMEISVLYGRQLQLTVDGEARTVWTTARTVEDALTQLDLNDPDSKLSASPVGGHRSRGTFLRHQHTQERDHRRRGHSCRAAGCRGPSVTP